MKRVWIPFISTFSILSVSIIVIDAGVIAAGGFVSEPFDILLVSALFLSIIFRYEWGLAVAIGGGILRDILHIAPLSSTISLVLVLIVTNTLFRLYVTNRSLWTLLLLGGVATAMHSIFFSLFQWSLDGILQRFSLQMVFHSIALSILYAAVWTLGTRLKTYLIVWK